MTRVRYDHSGVIAMLTDGQSHRPMVVRDCHTLEAVREVAKACDALGPQWRVMTLSTPKTIRTDLRGRGVGGERPERSMLRRIGRTDLLYEAGAIETGSG